MLEQWNHITVFDTGHCDPGTVVEVYRRNVRT